MGELTFAQCVFWKIATQQAICWSWVTNWNLLWGLGIVFPLRFSAEYQLQNVSKFCLELDEFISVQTGFGRESLTNCGLAKNLKAFAFLFNNTCCLLLTCKFSQHIIIFHTLQIYFRESWKEFMESYWKPGRRAQQAGHVLQKGANTFHGKFVVLLYSRFIFIFICILCLHKCLH